MQRPFREEHVRYSGGAVPHSLALNDGTLSALFTANGYSGAAFGSLPPDRRGFVLFCRSTISGISVRCGLRTYHVTDFQCGVLPPEVEPPLSEGSSWFTAARKPRQIVLSFLIVLDFVVFFSFMCLVILRCTAAPAY
jgi:hypothetical protein